MPSVSESIAIRAIAVVDADTAAGLSAELGYPIDAPTMRHRIEALSASADHGVFVACRGAQVVGWIHVSVVHHMQSDARAEIGGLVVATDARSAGIGAQLVARAERWAHDSGLLHIVVRSQIMREAAHRFYLREGYARTKTSAVFAKVLAPEPEA